MSNEELLNKLPDEHQRQLEEIGQSLQQAGISESGGIPTYNHSQSLPGGQTTPNPNLDLLHTTENYVAHDDREGMESLFAERQARAHAPQEGAMTAEQDAPQAEPSNVESAAPAQEPVQATEAKAPEQTPQEPVQEENSPEMSDEELLAGVRQTKDIRNDAMRDQPANAPSPAPEPELTPAPEPTPAPAPEPEVPSPGEE